MIAELDLPADHTRPSGPTNLTNNAAVALNEPIGSGDADCVVVIPAGIADEVVESGFVHKPATNIRRNFWPDAPHMAAPHAGIPAPARRWLPEGVLTSVHAARSPNLAAANGGDGMRGEEFA